MAKQEEEKKHNQKQYQHAEKDVVQSRM